LISEAPVTEVFTSKAGADGYTPNTASAVDEAKRVIGLK